MKPLSCWFLFGLIAVCSSASSQPEPQKRNHDEIKTPIVEVHMATANVGGGTLITSTSPKPRTNDSKPGDDLDRDPRVGDTLVIHGKYILASREKARIALILSPPKGTKQAVAFPLPSLEVQKGSGDFELTYTLNRVGFLSVGFFSIPENRLLQKWPMTPILPMWAGTLGPETPATETPSSDQPRSR